MKQIRNPLVDGEQQNLDVVAPDFFTTHPTTKRLKVGPHTKQYGLVFNKGIMDPTTFQSYPYGYTPVDLDEFDNVEVLLDL